MNDTTVTMIGNVLTAPEWRRTSNTATYVMTFRFAATSRRFDRMAGRWVDGDSLRLKVACWRTLGQNAFESIQLGDPLIISGRLYSRDWADSDVHKRTSYELDAISLGHDLSRGVAKFARRRPVAATESIDDAESRTTIGGETSAHVDPPELPPGVGPRPSCSTTSTRRSTTRPSFRPRVTATTKIPMTRSTRPTRASKTNSAT